MTNWVYAVVFNTGMVKIGHTSHIQRRMTGLSSCGAGRAFLLFTLKISSKAGATSAEREICKTLRGYRISGHEWFKPVVLPLLHDEFEIQRRHLSVHRLSSRREKLLKALDMKLGAIA